MLMFGIAKSSLLIIRRLGGQVFVVSCLAKFLIFPQTEHSNFGFTEVLIGHWLSSFGKPLIAACFFFLQLCCKLPQNRFQNFLKCVRNGIAIF